MTQIATAKAGIMKEDVKAFTVDQPPEAVSVLSDRASDLGLKLKVSSIDGLTAGNVVLGVAGDHQYLNAALAIDLCTEWLRINDPVLHEDLGFIASHGDDEAVRAPPGEFISALHTCYWPGRSQMVEKDGCAFSRRRKL